MAPTPPPQASGTTAALALLAMLTERYPATFRHEGEPPRPLAIGIGDRLITERALDPALVHTAMRLYTRRHAYRHALAQDGAMRVDLDGHEVEPVSEEHQALARTPRTHVAASQAQPQPDHGADDPHPRPLERTHPYACHCHLEAGTSRPA